MQQRPHFSLVKDMLQKAIAKLPAKAAPLLHPDQGWQYQMPAWCGLIQSMSRKGNCLDDAAMERFFATLKSELFYLRRFDCIEQLQAAIGQYIDDYNHAHIRTKLKGLSPVQYRSQASIAWLANCPSWGGQFTMPSLSIHARLTWQPRLLPFPGICCYSPIRCHTSSPA
ncbi:hypothetical protein CO613_02355 [Lysobacteraceae bacterium NML07-0707]|nr:hypothetical protein CO613_02355 [Xanthomonadaceae bacterium NML07-0707]